MDWKSMARKSRETSEARYEDYVRWHIRSFEIQNERSKIEKREEWNKVAHKARNAKFYNEGRNVRSQKKWLFGKHRILWSSGKEHII